MTFFKTFDLGGRAKLRVRSDSIIATVHSDNSNQIELYVSGIANPWHIPITDNDSSEIINYVWDTNVGKRVY